MIQRLQSVYLFMTTVLSLLFLKGSFINFIDKSGTVLKITFSGIYRETGGVGLELLEKVIPLSVVILIIPLISLIAIFLYKSRTIQLRLTLFLIATVSGFILLSGFYSWKVISGFGGEIVPGFKMVLPVLMLLFAILAYRGIKKDDQLVKSYDRLR
jgi:hypothetical protein